MSRLGLVIDVDACVGCHACATACKEWNGASLMAGGSPDYDPQGPAPSGVWFNRVRHYEAGTYPESRTLNVPMSCMHCEQADCVIAFGAGLNMRTTSYGLSLPLNVPLRAKLCKVVVDPAVTATSPDVTWVMAAETSGALVSTV